MTRVSAKEVTIGIDIGTTAVKAVAADEDGHVVARTRIPHQLRVPAPDRLEHDADEAWLRGPLAPARDRLEREMILSALRDAGGRLDVAAKALGISRKGLYLKRLRLGI